MSGSSETHQEISKKVGRKTIEAVTINDKTLDINTSRTKQVTEVPILTEERISTLLEGETIVLRFLHRQDLKRRKVRPFAIFNTKETSMPYRYEFLSKDFDMSKDINDFRVPSEHTYLDLMENSIDYKEMLNNAVMRSNNELFEDELPLKVTEDQLKELMISKGMKDADIDKYIAKLNHNAHQESKVEKIILAIDDSEVREYSQEYVKGVKEAS